MSIKFFRGRNSVLFSFIAFLLVASFLVHTVFVGISFSKADINFASLVGAILLVTALVMWLFYRSGVVANIFNSPVLLARRLLITGAIVTLSGSYVPFIKNSWAEQNSNHHQNNLVKAGILAFCVSLVHLYSRLNLTPVFL